MSLRTQRTASLELASARTAGLSLHTRRSPEVFSRGFESDETWVEIDGGSISTTFAHTGSRSAELAAAPGNVRQDVSPSINIDGLSFSMWIYPDIATPAGQVNLRFRDTSARSNSKAIALSGLTGKSWNRVAFSLGFGTADLTDISEILVSASFTTETTYVDQITGVRPTSRLRTGRTAALDLRTVRTHGARVIQSSQADWSGWTGGTPGATPSQDGEGSLLIAPQGSAFLDAVPVAYRNMAGRDGLFIDVYPTGWMGNGLFVIKTTDGADVNTLSYDVSAGSLNQWNTVWAAFDDPDRTHRNNVTRIDVISEPVSGPSFYIDRIYTTPVGRLRTRRTT